MEAYIHMHTMCAALFSCELYACIADYSMMRMHYIGASSFCPISLPSDDALRFRLMMHFASVWWCTPSIWWCTLPSDDAHIYSHTPCCCWYIGFKMQAFMHVHMNTFFSSIHAGEMSISNHISIDYILSCRYAQACLHKGINSQCIYTT